MSSELVKLYYRIGEVSSIVGVQPHVLRYWESEFRTIRPQKSHKGQRVYSRRDVERLLFVKDLLKNQGFTIAGAKRRLREPAELGGTPRAASVVVSAPEVVSSAVPASSRELGPIVPRESKSEGKALRMALLAVRGELASWVTELEAGSRAREL
jgi:DNA-binding transcriptional MerR regulator